MKSVQNFIIALIFLNLLSCLPQIEMIKYIPKTERYQITYPENYFSKENEEGIVTITSPDRKTNMTLSGYNANGEVDSKVLNEFMVDVTKEYELLASPEIETYKDGLKISGKYKKEGNDWLWKIYSEKNAIVIVSINGKGSLSEDEINAYESILDNLELYFKKKQLKYCN